MKIKSFVISALLFGTINASADVGNSGWIMLRKIQSAQFRAISASVTGCENLTGLLTNPAVAGDFDEKQFMLISEAGFNDDKLGGVLLTLPYGKWSISGGFAYYDLGSEELFWYDGAALNSRTVNVEKNYFGIISAQYKLTKWLFAGLSVKGLTTQLVETYTASALAADVGFFAVPFRNFSLSLALQNSGVGGKFISADNPLPQSIYAGMGKVFELKKSYIALAAGVNHMMIDETTTPEAGIELGSGILSINFGYSFNTEGVNTHIGTEIVFKDLVLGYAYIPSDSMGGAGRVTLTYKFANVAAKKYYENTDNDDNPLVKPREEYRRPPSQRSEPPQVKVKLKPSKPRKKPPTLSDY